MQQHTNRKRLEGLFLFFSFFISFLWVNLLFWGQYPEWWQWIIFERTPMTWFESMLLVLCSFQALMTAVLLQTQKTNLAAGALRDASKIISWWVAISAIFFVLALDERLALHERVRDSFLAPAGIKIPLFFWTPPGDFLLLVAAVGGLFLLPRLLRLFDEAPARRLFLSAVVVSAFAVVADSLDVHQWSIEAQRLEQFLEELAETAAQLFFLNSFFRVFLASAGNPFSRGSIND